MRAFIANFRLGRKTKSNTHMVVKVDGVTTRKQAEKYVGKSVVWTSPAKKEIKGKVASAHGNSGALRVIFEKGMPGQAVTNEVKLE